MAKKTGPKLAKPKIVKESEATREDIQILHNICLTITARLDRIVAAASKAKPITKDM